jgi:hypothetical protein
MSPQEIEKLLGGYATDTLTEEERRALFEAALGNQALFDALADDQALKELLDDPPSRTQLLAALREERVSPVARVVAWWRRPSFLAAAAAVAAGIVTIAVVIPHKPAAEKQAMVARNAPPQPAPEPPAVLQSEPEPRPAAAAPAGGTRRAASEKREEEPERDALRRKPAPAAAESVAVAPGVAPAATPPAATAPVAAAAPPPPAAQAAAVSQAQSQGRSELKPQEQAKTAADNAAPAGAPAFRQEERKKEAEALVTGGARQLYYLPQPSVSGFVDQQAVNKAKKQSFGRGVAPAARMAAAAPAMAVGGVRYSILRRNTDGSFVEVDPAAVFAPGDALRLRFETNQAGNLAVMEHPASGPWTLRLGARTQPGVPVLMPAESAIDVTAAGPLRFFVRFSRSLRGEARLDQVTPTPNLLRESAANSVYVVNPVASADPTVDFELAINAR